MRALVICAMLSLTCLGCYGVPQDRLIDLEDAEATIECDHGMSTSCVEGTVVAAPEIYINNRKFEDSEDFALMFSELITVEDEEGKALADDEYQIELMTPINNRQFTRDFEVYLRGKETRNTEVLQNGKFYVNYLKPGFYDIRAQRKLVFKVTKPQVTEEETGEVLEEAVEKFYCATLKSEQTIQLRTGESMTPVIEEFDLFWREQGCSADETNFGLVTL